MLFSHDGIHDSQTHLSSPSYFYEQLRREILIAARTNKPVALVKILFSNPESDQVRAHDVLHFAYELTQLTRQDECVGRLGINEVVIIVRDGKSHAEQLVQRLVTATSLTVDHTLQIKVSIIQGIGNETSLSLLARLDRADVSGIHSAS
jgi:GGDEF domain-containing protein